MFAYVLQDMAAPVVDGNDAVTGHIISTTIGGKNGEPKQVYDKYLNSLCHFPIFFACEVLCLRDLNCLITHVRAS